MTIKIFEDFEQNSDEWLQARCGLLTASNMKLLLTPTLKMAKNENEKTHLYELLAQRITKYVEPTYQTHAMMRGHLDEIEAILEYEDKYGPVKKVGFITNDRWGFTLGYSPDGLVGSDGGVEAKSRAQKFQAKTVIECMPEGMAPEEYMMQIQTGQLVGELKWIDFLSWCGGMPMVKIRVYPDPVIQDAIINVVGEFENRIAMKYDQYKAILRANPLMTPTERRVDDEIFV